MINTIIIEDEAAALDEMYALLIKHEDIKILGSSGTLTESIKLIQYNKVDLVFMDISLYDCTAFDILNHLDISFHIIFVTAYNEYAIKAIKLGALDYLLKPIHEEELKDAIQRFREVSNINTSKQQVSLSSMIYQNKKPITQLALSTIGEVEIIELEDIIYCRGDGPYTHLFLTNGNTKTISKPLKYYTNLLPDTFIRTHQSYLVNRSCIKSIQHSSTIVLNTGEEIPISLRRKADILKILKP